MTEMTAHAALYADLYAEFPMFPRNAVINVCELSTDDARLVSGDVAAVAAVLGVSAEDGDTWNIDAMLTARFRALLAEDD